MQDGPSLPATIAANVAAAAKAKAKKACIAAAATVTLCWFLRPVQCLRNPAAFGFNA